MSSNTWNRQRAAHLFRRAGFGARPAELDAAVAAGREEAVDRLLSFQSVSTSSLDARLASLGFDLTTFFADDDPRRYQQFAALQRWWYLRMIYTPRPLEEKLTLFWHNHFATSWNKVDNAPLLYAQNQLFRSLAIGRFRDLLLGIARDSAMLFYLDNNTNVKESIQENWGRELLELFTMGVNRYTQQDVRAAAAAFTGWTNQPDPPYAFVFDASEHDFGDKTFLGQSGPFDGTDVIEILSRRPETAEFVTTKLARFFLGFPPRRTLGRRLSDVFLSSGGSIRSVVRVILLSEDFDESADRCDQVKSPTELLVGALKHFDTETNAAPLLDYAPLVGQSLFLPPNVAGWPAWTAGSRRWINTGSYLWRLYFANDVAAARPGADGMSWDHRLYFPASIRTADELIDWLAERLNMLPPAPQLRRALHDYLAQMGPFRWNPDEIADRWGRGAARLMLSSPQYQVQ